MYLNHALSLGLVPSLCPYNTPGYMNINTYSHVVLPAFYLWPTRQFLLLKSQFVSHSSVSHPLAQSLENGKCSITIS